MDEEIFLGVMDLQEAKNHQYSLKEKGILVRLKTNSATCTTGCKVTVEVWGNESDKEAITEHLRDDYLKNLKGHLPDFDSLNSVFDPSLEEVSCQACGMKFDPKLSECPDCGLVY